MKGVVNLNPKTKSNDYSYKAEVICYTREEVANLLHVNVDVVSGLMASGCLSSIKIGRRYIIPHMYLTEFLHNYKNQDLSNFEVAVAAAEDMNKS